jgi:lipopolysaccharide export LptBFGC system permease protein LptF
LVLALVSRRRVRRTIGAAAACGILLGYYVLVFATRALGLVDGTLPPVAAVWLPNEEA